MRTLVALVTFATNLVVIDAFALPTWASVLLAVAAGVTTSRLMRAFPLDRRP